MKKLFIAICLTLLLCVSAVSAAKPYNVTVQPEDGKVTVAWKNPTGVSISDIDVLNGSGASVASELSKTAGAVNLVTVSGLENDRTYTFTVRITANGETEDTQVEATPVKKDKTLYTADGYKIPKWNWRYSEGAIIRLIDTEEKHEGNSSLKIISNYYKTYLQTFADKIVLDETKTYRLTFWAKLQNNANNKVQFLDDWKDPRRTISGNTWKQYTWDFGGKKDFLLRFLCETTCDALWIDDIQLHEIADGEITGENLFPNGNFEFEAYNLSLENMTLSWTEPENSGYKGVDIYMEMLDGTREKLNGELIPKGTVTFTLPESCDIDESYNLIVIADINNEKNIGTKYTVYGKADYFDTILTKSGEVITKLEEGEITVTKAVRNNKMGDDFKACLILALYRDDELVEMKYSQKLIPENMQKTELSENITIPNDGENYELQVFIWDDPDEMDVLKSFESYCK